MNAFIISLDDYSDKEKVKNMLYKHQSFLKYRKKWLEIQHETTIYYCFIKYQGKLLIWANSKIVQNTFDSWKCQLLCNKMSKVENFYKPWLKTILKQHHFNVNRATNEQILMHANFDFRSHGQICIYAKFAYMQIEICTWSQNLKDLLLHTCANPFTWSDLHTWVYLHICKYLHTYANLSMWKHL